MLRKAALWFMYFVSVFSVVSLSLIFFSESAITGADFSKIDKVAVTGSYSINGGEWLPLPQDGELPGVKDNCTVNIKGHFSDGIDVNKTLMMRIDNLFVTMKINGKTVYTFGQEGSYANFSESPGNVWDSWQSTGVLPQDDVEIELENAYTNHVSIAFKTFLNGMRMGDGGDMVISLLRMSYRNVLPAMFIIFLGFVMLVMSIILIRRRRNGEEYLLLSLFSVSAGFWLFIDFDVQSIFVPLPVFSNGVDIVALLILQMFLLVYLASLFKTKARSILYAPAVTAALLIMVSTITQLTGVYDYYRYTSVIAALVFIEIAAVIAAFIIEVTKRGVFGIRRSLMPMLIVISGAAVDTVCYVLGVFPQSFFFKIALIVFLASQFARILKEFRDVFIADAKVKLLEQLAYRDALTHVPNRLAYEDKSRDVDNCILSGTQEMFGLAAFDINGLKSTNDTYGHEAGDELIRAASSAICHAFAHCPVYRIGGDEFVAYLNDNECKRCDELLRMLTEFSDEYNENNPECAPVSIAAGTAIYDAKSDASFESVMARADKVMYGNKEQMKAVGRVTAD